MPRLDRFWQALESVPGRACLLVEWRDLFGADYELVQRFLAPTNQRGQAYPCPHPAGDGCPRRIVEHDEDRLVAVCGDSPRRCESVALAREDLIVYEVDVAALASEVAAALAIRPQVQGTGISTWRVGEYVGARGRLPTYLTIRISAGEVDAVVRDLLLTGERPFLLLAPTSRLLRVRSRELLGNAGCAFAALKDLVQVGGAGELVGTALSKYLPGGDGDASADQSVFRLDGDHWTVSFGGTTKSIEDAKGMRYLKVLLSYPGRQYPPAALATGAGEGPPPAKLHRDDGLDSGGGSLGPSLDARAEANYRERLRELGVEIASAEANNDQGRLDRYRREKEAIEAELVSAYGLGGRARDKGDPVKRARDRVTAAIGRTRKRLAELHPPLSAHLDLYLRQGSLWSYDPQPPVPWQL